MLYYNTWTERSGTLTYLVESFAPARASAPPRPTTVAWDRAEVLFRIHDPGTRLAVWNRPEPAGWAAATEGLLAAAPFSLAAEDEPNAAVARVLDGNGLGVPDALARDMRFLAGLFSALSMRAVVRVRLDGITGDACRKWHVDAVRFRMLCTYRGVGTEWRDGEDGVPGSIAASSVAVLKGEAFGKGRGCLHRSPPLSALPAHERRRLLFVVDEPGHFPA